MLQLKILHAARKTEDPTCHNQDPAGPSENIHKYLIDDGYFLLNINDFDEYPLVADSIAIAEQVGFKYQGKEYLKNNNRCKQGGFMDSGEGILVFTLSNRGNK